VPLKLDAYTACPHDRPLGKAVEVLKANFRRGEASQGQQVLHDPAAGQRVTWLQHELP
jgi:hypothetical protein